MALLTSETCNPPAMSVEMRMLPRGVGARLGERETEIGANLGKTTDDQIYLSPAHPSPGGGGRFTQPELKRTLLQKQRK